MSTVSLGTPYRADQSARNTQAVLQAVAKRFPEWSSQCAPYVNVLTLKAWNQRGFRVKKGEHSIRIPVIVPVFKEEDGKKVPVANRPSTACLFALPQVERKDDSPHALPVVEIDGKRYFKDDRLQQYRNVENPHDYMPM